MPYLLQMKPPGKSLTERVLIGTVPAKDKAELDVCLLSCVSLLCGLQGGPKLPSFHLMRINNSGQIEALASLLDHKLGWRDPQGKEFDLEAL